MTAVIRLAVIGRHAAAVVRDQARHVLELDRCVIDVEVAQDLIDSFQNPFARRRRHIFDQHVTTERVRTGPETPDVKIVDI